MGVFIVHYPIAFTVVTKQNLRVTNTGAMWFTANDMVMDGA